MTISAETPVSETRFTVRVRDRGQITVPQSLRDQLELREGDIVDVVRVGEALVVTQRPLRVPQIADRFADVMDGAGVTLADLLTDLAEQRQPPDA